VLKSCFEDVDIKDHAGATEPDLRLKSAVTVLGVGLALQYLRWRWVQDKDVKTMALVIVILSVAALLLNVWWCYDGIDMWSSEWFVIPFAAIAVFMCVLEATITLNVGPTNVLVQHKRRRRALFYRLEPEGHTPDDKKTLTHIEERTIKEGATGIKITTETEGTPQKFTDTTVVKLSDERGLGWGDICRNGWLVSQFSDKPFPRSVWRCCAPSPVAPVAAARARAVQTTMTVVNEVYRLALPSVRMSGKAVERTLLGLLKVNPEAAPVPESMGACQPVCDSMGVWMPVWLAGFAGYMLKTKAYDLMDDQDKFNTNFATCAADDPTAQLKRATNRGTMTSIISAIYTNMLNAGYDVDGNINPATSTAMIGLLLNSTIGYLADTGFATNDGLRAFYKKDAEWCSKDLVDGKIGERKPEIKSSLLDPTAFQTGWTRMIGTLGSGQFLRFFVTNMLDVFVNLTIFTQGFVLFQNYVPFFRDNPVWANTMLSGFLSVGTYYAYSAFVRVMYAYWSPHEHTRDGAMHFAGVFALTSLAGVVFLLADTQDYSDPTKMGVTDQMVNHPLVKFFMLWGTLGLMGVLAMNSMSQTELSGEKVFDGVFCLRRAPAADPVSEEAADAVGEAVATSSSVEEPAASLQEVDLAKCRGCATDGDEIVMEEGDDGKMKAMCCPKDSFKIDQLTNKRYCEAETTEPSGSDDTILVAKQRTVHLPGETQDVRMGAALACLLVWGTTWVTFATSRKLHRFCASPTNYTHCVSGIGCPLAQSLLLTCMFVGPLGKDAVYGWMQCFAIKAPIELVALFSSVSFVLSCLSTTLWGTMNPLDDARASFA